MVVLVCKEELIEIYRFPITVSPSLHVEVLLPIEWSFGAPVPSSLVVMLRVATQEDLSVCCRQPPPSRLFICVISF